METSIEDRKYVWHPFTQMKTARTPISIAKGKGSYIYSEDGKRYIDAISSWWVNLHGHTHPHIVEKIKSQAETLEHVIFADFTHRPAVDLARRLLSILPKNMNKIFYSDNGSTAVEVALKMAIQYWKNKGINKTKIISFKQGYHGDTFGAMSASGKNEFNRPFWPHLFEVESIDPPLPGREEVSLKQLKAILTQQKAACFIFEPLILGSGGMLIYAPEALNTLLTLCRQYNVLTIADEVMTGFGRTDTLFACEQLDLSPDFICLSKGLTGGFLPLGATACTSNIYEAFLADSLQAAFLHGHSYTANPLSCSSALGSLDLLLDPACYIQRQCIANLHACFCEKWRNHPRIKRCESIGTILVLEYATSNPSYFNSLKDTLYSFFLEKGILLRPLGHVLYIMPPYCISEEDLIYIYTQIVSTLEKF